MQRGWLALVLFACTSEPLEPRQSCELANNFPITPGPRVDLLFVIDPRAAAMAQYGENMRRLGNLVELMFAKSSEIRVGVVSTADGRMQQGDCVPRDDRYLIYRHIPWWPPFETNYRGTGTVTDAIVCLTRVAGEPLVEPVGAMKLALGTTPGFVGPDYLQTVVIATEDETHPAVAEARAYLVSLKSEPHHVVSSVIAPAASVGWPALIGESWDVFTAIENGNWSGALDQWATVLPMRLPWCIGASIADAEQCVVTDATESTRNVLPPCAGNMGPRPCWWAESDRTLCPDGEPTAMYVDREDYPTELITVSVRCPCPL